MGITLPVSLGEALDKLTILDIKIHKIQDERRKDCQKEYDLLDVTLKPYRTTYDYYYKLLREINLEIWELQDTFHGKDTAPEEGAAICKKILEENDRRFRVKSKLNHAASSLLKEQKGYARRRVFFYGHLGLGDMFWMNGAVRYLATTFDEVVVACKERNLENVKAMYADDPTIHPFSLKDEVSDVPFFRWRHHIEQDEELTVLTCGQHSANPRIYEFPHSFYDDLKMSRDIRTKYFHVPTVAEATALYEAMGGRKYAIIHEQSSTKTLSIWEAVQKQKPELLLLDINRNHYAAEHPYYTLAGMVVGKPLLHYKMLLENASEIHLLESSLYCFASHLDLSKVERRCCYDAFDHSNERLGVFTTCVLDV